MRYLVPLAAFVALLVLLAVGLKLDPRRIPSALIDKPAPFFALSELADPTRQITKTDLLGRPLLLNVWASWCSACRVEHPLLVELAQTKGVEIVGLNYKDTRADAAAWLERHGNPYRRSIYDPDGKLGLDLGVYGVPETFVLDADGVIRYKQVGPLTAEIWANEVAPLLAKLGTAE